MKRFLCALIVLVCCVFAAACAAAAQETSHAHVWEETAVWREPTCTEAGELLRICSVCSLSERIPIPARGHETGDWLHDDTAHWKECTVCKERQETAPHHISDGVCTVCGAGFGSGSQEEGHTHSYVRLEEVPASCTEDTAGNGIRHSIGTSAAAAAGQRMRSRTVFWAGTSARSAGQSALPRAASGIRTTGTKGRSPTPPPVRRRGRASSPAAAAASRERSRSPQQVTILRGRMRKTGNSTGVYAPTAAAQRARPSRTNGSCGR